MDRLFGTGVVRAYFERDVVEDCLFADIVWKYKKKKRKKRSLEDGGHGRTDTSTQPHHSLGTARQYQ
jgi:hypothetical protein